MAGALELEGKKEEQGKEKAREEDDGQEVEMKLSSIMMMPMKMSHGTRGRSPITQLPVTENDTVCTTILVAVVAAEAASLVTYARMDIPMTMEATVAKIVQVVPALGAPLPPHQTLPLPLTMAPPQHLLRRCQRPVAAVATTVVVADGLPSCRKTNKRNNCTGDVRELNHSFSSMFFQPAFFAARLVFFLLRLAYIFLHLPSPSPPIFIHHLSMATTPPRCYPAAFQIHIQRHLQVLCHGQDQVIPDVALVLQHAQLPDAATHTGQEPVVHERVDLFVCMYVWR